eukprot:TRINITY_DN6948_c0_g2_i1.p1 TRINITY_DN6948_c0_g2~~TRINITY_DN6948_c0_g2_i1.p1  ORF type:complete len:194 (-),score=43.74 TRINITY_DN6948_c0_g2_i1:269-850(-)
MCIRDSNAGISGKHTLDDWASGAAYSKALSVMEVNVLSVVNVTGSFIPLLLKESSGCPWPRIVNIGSLAGLAAKRGSAIYSGSKAAIERISDDLRRMLKPRSVWVSLVEPGFVASGMCNRPECLSSTAASTTTPVIVDALTSTHPRPRYPVAGAYGFPGWLIVSIHSLLPDQIVDGIYAVIEPQPAASGAKEL